MCEDAESITLRDPYLQGTRNAQVGFRLEEASVKSPCAQGARLDMPAKSSGKQNGIPSLMYCFGAIFGDGCVFQETSKTCYVLLFSSHRKPFADRVYEGLKQSGYNPYYFPRFDPPNSFRWIVKVKNKQLYEEYQEFRRTLCLTSLPTKDASEFVRGFFDAEGCMRSEAVFISNTNIDLLKQIQSFLEKRSIHAGLSIRKCIGKPVSIRGAYGTRRKDLGVLSIYRDRKEFAKFLIRRD
jgi:intein-encoded DNA endonuclease-like protein